MKTIDIARLVAAAALIAGGAGACGSNEPAPPPKPSQAPAENPARPGSPTSDKPKPQELTRTPAPQRQSNDTDDRPLPKECKRPAGASLRQSCIKEFGPEGVGTVEPVPPKHDRDGNGIDDSVETPEPEPTPTRDEPTQDEGQVPPKKEQIEQCIEQTGKPQACREKIDPE